MDALSRLPAINTIHLTLFGEITETNVPSPYSLSIALPFLLICSFMCYFSKREKEMSVWTELSIFFVVVVEHSTMFYGNYNHRSLQNLF